jgi:hypothetical protein
MSEGPRQTQTLNSIDRDPAYETPGKKAAQILEKSLEEYEDYALLGEAFARFFLVKGSHVGFDKKLLDDPFYKNSRLFRNYLLTVRPGGKLTTRDLEKFLPSKNAVAFDRQTQDAYQATKDVFQRNMIRGSTVDAMDPFFAVELALWTQNSRKIVSLNTKAFASFTDPKEPYESSWDEMIFPHETFMIEPPQGAHKVTLSGVEHQLVGLMVNHNEELHRVSIRPFFEPVDKIYRTRVNSNEFLEATEKFLKGKITPQSAYAFSKAQQEEERKNPDGMRRLRYHGNAFAFSTLGPPAGTHRRAGSVASSAPRRSLGRSRPGQRLAVVGLWAADRYRRIRHLAHRSLRSSPWSHECAGWAGPVARHPGSAAERAGAPAVPCGNQGLATG